MMIYSHLNKEFTHLLELVREVDKKIDVDRERLFEFYKCLYDLNDLIHYLSYENNDYELYYNEMFRNLFESFHLGMIGKKTPAMHMIRSSIELYAKLQVSRENIEVDDKFSTNIDRFIKKNKKGKKKTQKIITETKDELKDLYYYYCDYVHTKHHNNIKVFEVMEEILKKETNKSTLNEVLDELIKVLNKIICVDILSYCHIYYYTIPHIVLVSYKDKYLSNRNKDYFIEVTQNEI